MTNEIEIAMVIECLRWQKRGVRVENTPSLIKIKFKSQKYVRGQCIFNPKYLHFRSSKHSHIAWRVTFKYLRSIRKTVHCLQVTAVFRLCWNHLNERRWRLWLELKIISQFSLSFPVFGSNSESTFLLLPRALLFTNLLLWRCFEAFTKLERNFCCFCCRWL